MKESEDCRGRKRVRNSPSSAVLQPDPRPVDVECIMCQIVLRVMPRCQYHRALPAKEKSPALPGNIYFIKINSRF